MSDLIYLSSPLSLIKLHPGLYARHKFNQGNECGVERGGWGAIRRLKEFNLFFSFQGWEPMCHSRTHTHPCKHLSICQISTPIVPLACSRDTQRHSKPPPPKTPAQPPTPSSSPSLLRPLPRLPDLIKLINSPPAPLPISFLLVKLPLPSPTPSLITFKVNLMRLYQHPCSRAPCERQR